MIRGLIMNGREVVAGLKIGDVDPRPMKELCHTVSDKALSIGRAVLEALLYLEREKHSQRADRT
jgi:xanthine dehydrogenase accessory factor